MLRNINYKDTYRTYLSDVNKEFFTPCFTNSIKFDRGVGFFTLSSLINILEFDYGLIDFIKNNGVIRIIASPLFTEEDLNLINKGMIKSIDKSYEIINKEINVSLASDELNKMDLITNLIASGKLEIKIAVLKNAGLYHEKIGFFIDLVGDCVYFIGSNNQTGKANTINLETFSIKTSWEYSIAVNNEHHYFNELWDNKFDPVNSYSLPEANALNLIHKYKKSQDINEAIDNYVKEKSINKIKESKDELQLRPYQKIAIERIKKYKQDIFQMATGTGKTYTAVKAIKDITTQEPLLVVVIVPQLSLLAQWEKVFVSQGFYCYIFSGSTTNNINEILPVYNSKKETTIIISTYKTFFSKIAKRIIKKEDVFFIADEVHNINKNCFLNLPKKARYKLGLSATPERYDSDETKNIFDFFVYPGNEPFKYEIEDAIKDNYLIHYNYYTFFSELTEKETQDYLEITEKLRKYFDNKNKNDVKSLEKRKQREALLSKRSLILKKATNKMEKLKEIVINEEINFANSLVYCGQGKDDESTPIIDLVSTIIGDKYKVRKYTSKEPMEERKKIFEQFYNDELETLIAIKCLDEGVDIPKLGKIIIIASDGTIKQTIQRRGRVLRLCKDSNKEIANIFDFVILPPRNSKKEIVKPIVVTELTRFREYNRLAENCEENLKTLDLIEDDYGITEEDYKNSQKFMEQENSMYEIIIGED